jgi:hypothetical protein
MKFKKMLGAVAAAAALISGGAHAAVNVGGVIWTPGSLLDFTGQSALFEATTFTVDSEIRGIGQINLLNGAALVCAECELTYEFGGYKLLDLNPGDFDPDGAGPITGAQYGYTPPTSLLDLGNFAFTGGWLKLYVDGATPFNSLSAASANDGTLWLDLLAVDQSGSNLGTTLAGSLTQQFAAGVAGRGNGLFDVVGGLAAGNIDTNMQIGGRDLSFTSSFQPNPRGGVTPDGFDAFGTGEFAGASVPEPGMLALLGLGLVGIGFARRNKKQA